MNLEYLDVVILLVIGCVAMYAPEIMKGVRTYRRGRELAQRITQEHEARKALEKRAQ